MERVEVGGLEISYERAGSGPPLVLVHGFVGDGRSTWSAQLDDLSDEFTVVAWDAPGAGHSARPPDLFHIADYADCLADFICALRLGRTHLVGLSFGGIVALELFRRRSVVPRTLVLAGAYSGWAGSLPPDQAPSFPLTFIHMTHCGHVSSCSVSLTSVLPRRRRRLIGRWWARPPVVL